MLMVFWTLFLGSIPAQSQSGGGCNASGPEHYLAIQRSHHPERLTMAFPNDLVVSIECREILTIPQGLDSVIAQAKVHLERLHDTINTLGPPWLISITPADNGMIRIAVETDTIAPLQMVYHPDNQKYQPAHFRYNLVFRVSYQHTLVISMNAPTALKQLSSVVVDTLVARAITHVAKQEFPRWAAKSVTYQVLNGDLDTEGAHFHRLGSRKMGFNISPGLSYLNTTVAPSFAFPLVYARSTKRGNTISYGISFELLLHMDAEEPYRIRNNWYAEGLFRFGNPAATLSAGYLIHREGDLLPPNACRIGASVPINRSGSLQWFSAYHFSVTNKGQNLVETGIRLWR